ncbi:hypothetical protein [Streptacidiphilus fuscans]|uniref:Uncharacterized protein n=1 Tax=Streptacidiphilus fuscans TaxID=2789292 RepID=A0A931BE43_9ACTN|nr:hypothetical protein [Streptacidiphilus fuscans]MBF9072518.1 hypothetical protein [Streptacidiphilus fuscans]
MTIVVTDACSLINFAASDDMAVLKVGLEYRTPRCTQAVHAELLKHRHNFPKLKPLIDEEWLGEPIELNHAGDRDSIGRLRTALGGTRADQLLHLGEAESIHAIQTRTELSGGVLLTDDRDARRLAGQKNILVWDTTRLLAEIHIMGDLEWEEAQNILVRMDQAQRGVRIPANYQDFTNG